MFGAILKELMKLENEGTKDIAALCGLKFSTVNAWFHKDSIPHAKILMKLADHFNVSVDYLLGRTDNLFVQIGNAEMHMSANQKERFLKLERLNEKALQELDGYIDYKLSLQEK